jgi:hypothetical protein
MENKNIEEQLIKISSPDWIRGNNILIFFTHEWALNRENKGKIIQCCNYAVMNRFKFDFLDTIQNK